MVCGIHDEVLAHHSQADETKITTGFSVRSADIDAGKTRTEVSITRQQVYYTERAPDQV